MNARHLLAATAILATAYAASRGGDAGQATSRPADSGFAAPGGRLRPATRPAPARARQEREAARPRRPARAEAGEMPPLTPAEVDPLLAFTREHFPRMHQRLQRVREADPVAFRQMLRRLRGPLARLQEVEQRDPRLAARMIEQQKLEMEIFELRRQHRAAYTAEERARIESDIRERIGQKFNARMERLKFEVAELRRRLDEQTKRLAGQEERREQLIEKEYRELMSRPERGNF